MVTVVNSFICCLFLITAMMPTLHFWKILFHSWFMNDSCKSFLMSLHEATQTNWFVRKKVFYQDRRVHFSWFQSFQHFVLRRLLCDLQDRFCRLLSFVEINAGLVGYVWALFTLSQKTNFAGINHCYLCPLKAELTLTDRINSVWHNRFLIHHSSAHVTRSYEFNLGTS